MELTPQQTWLFLLELRRDLTAVELRIAKMGDTEDPNVQLEISRLNRELHKVHSTLEGSQ